MGKSPKKDDIEGSEAPKPLATKAEEKLSTEETSTEDSKTTKPKDWFDAVRDGDEKSLKQALAKHLNEIIARVGLSKYEVLFLFDEDTIANYHADRLYSAAREVQEKNKDIADH